MHIFNIILGSPASIISLICSKWFSCKTQGIGWRKCCFSQCHRCQFIDYQAWIWNGINFLIPKQFDKWQNQLFLHAITAFRQKVLNSCLSRLYFKILYQLEKNVVKCAFCIPLNHRLSRVSVLITISVNIVLRNLYETSKRVLRRIWMKARLIWFETPENRFMESKKEFFVGFCGPSREYYYRNTWVEQRKRF